MDNKGDDETETRCPPFVRFRFCAFVGGMFSNYNLNCSITYYNILA